MPQGFEHQAAAQSAAAVTGVYQHPPDGCLGADDPCGDDPVTYYYSQAVKTDETSKKMLVTLQGQVLAVDDSAYRLPPSDTLSYVVSSMLSFVDTVPRYRIKVIDKFVTVEDRNYIQFFVVLM